MRKIGVLTSSRADYGIYLPLLKAMRQDASFDIRIIAFGTHLSSFHGYTIDQVIADGFTIDHTVEHILASDSEEAVATSMSVAAGKFANIWEREKKNYDLVFCLGDRYEMFAAVSAAAPFGINFAHFHGGETTLGAIDNQFRHCITQFSNIHFVSVDQYAARVAEIKGGKENIHVVGALSLASLDNIKIMSVDEMKQAFQVDLSVPSLLVTFHPETVNAEKNADYATSLVSALQQLGDYQVIITMPNADTKGNAMRAVYQEYAKSGSNVRLVENFGSQGYFSCMHWCRLVVGNSSSGIIEAASFKKQVVNIGRRQEGRMTSSNIIHCDAESRAILEACRKGLAMGDYAGDNIYYKRNGIQQVISVLKK